MEKTLLNIKIDRNLKKKAQKTAKELGLPLGTIINAQLRDLVRDKRVVFSTPLVPNARTRKLLDRIEKDIQEGKNTVGPFESGKEVQEYLDSLK
ncbi:MAG: type II toxin-antitoxin system RelB/DinJ family antitoxin [Candidatus Paceibacteria bacterium]